MIDALKQYNGSLFNVKDPACQQYEIGIGKLINFYFTHLKI